MKELKFRQPLEVGGFHYWGYIEDKFVSPVSKNQATRRSDMFICQYDKTDKEIYENDFYLIGLCEFAEAIDRVVFLGNQFMGMTADGTTYPLTPEVARTIVVIGNTHEDPVHLEAHKT